MSEFYDTVEIGDQEYTSETLAENRQMVDLVTGENSYNLGEVSLELRGTENLTDEQEKELSILSDI
ncbi:MAG: hypothetical protein ABEJ56_04350 [Candidatus Nanohaloarchaea archaeon]